MLSTVQAWLIALVATSTMAVSYVDRQAFAVLGPTITDSLHISNTAFGWLGSAFSIAYLVFAPVAGAAVDRFGARRGLVVSVLAWSAVAAAHALVPGVIVLFMLRILLGCAEAPSFPGAAQSMNRVLPPRQQSAGFGVLFTGSSIGAAVSAIVAPALDARYGWRIALVATAVAGLAWIPLWIAVTSSKKARAALDVAPAPAHAAQERAPATARFRELLADRDLLRAVCAVVASGPINGLVLVFGAKILVAQNALTQAQVGHYLWLPPLAFDGGSVLFGVVAGAVQRRTRTVGAPRSLFALAGALCLAVGALGLAGTPWQTTSVMAVALAGGGGVYALTTSDLLLRVGKDRVAATGGLLAAAQSLALIIAFPIIGAVVDRTHSYAGAGVGLAVSGAVGLGVWLAVRPRRRLDA